jgi:hypothetical protein
LSKPKKLALHLTEINFRGSTVATVSYAKGLLATGVTVMFVAPCSARHEYSVTEHLKSLGVLLFYENWNELDIELDRRGVEAIYILKSGVMDELVSKVVPTWVHAVFPTAISDFHGDRFAFISEWLADFSSCGAMPYVPHAVRPPAVVPGLREELRISSDALVLGYYGGETSFDIQFARVGLKKALEQRRDLYAIFLNVIPFIIHERAIFLEGTSDLIRKDKFVTACDAMIHARTIGETFGVACAEFSAANKPIITYAHSHQKAHLHMLGDKAITYNSYKSFEETLMNLDRVRLAQGDWNAFKTGYDETSVAQRFIEVFGGSSVPIPGVASRLCVARKAFAWRIERHWRKRGFSGFERL